MSILQWLALMRRAQRADLVVDHLGSLAASIKIRRMRTMHPTSMKAPRLDQAQDISQSIVSQVP
jgi:hypothetical protein